MDTIEFHKTTTRELKAIQDRMRNLVPNWLEDGMYKEAVLRGVIKSFLPKNFDVASGYVVSQTDLRGVHAASNQIDIIVFDNSYPVLFRKEELVVVTADSVRAIIEVKSSNQSEVLETTLEKCNKKGAFIFNNRHKGLPPLFNGIFYFNFNYKQINRVKKYLQGDATRVSSAIPINTHIVDHIAYGENIFYKFWKKGVPESNRNPDNPELEIRNGLYNTEELAFAFFISNLMSYLQPETIEQNKHLWFPVDKSWNERRILTF